ncbi:MAG TPA: ATP-binding protein [Vicinamibacterales bacterium]|jgi:signal transduction histidine kinase/CheY-like chemotaxis protein|nr:ATP-binding protein [Vicinamibacterales bacterium]
MSGPRPDATAAEGVSSAVRAELLDPAAWRDALQGYTRATKLAVLMVDETGAAIGACVNPHRLWEVVTAGGPKAASCPFCLHPASNCQALADARQSGSITFARDRSGLAHAVVPVRLGPHSLAFLLAGQIFDQFPEQLLLDDLARATATSPAVLWDLARRELPVSRTLLQAYADLLSTLAESYVRANHAAILDRQRYAEILGLHADLAERKEIEAALKQADRRKDQFLATLAHELRNPLAPMVTAVHLLKNGAANARPADRALSTLDRQLHHMVRLIDDLLDFSRISRGQIALRRERVAVSDLIAMAVETSRPEIEQRKHRLQVVQPDDPVWLDADPVRISQAISNLLNNAARYMNPGGEVRLSVARQGHRIVVSVADTGVGIEADVIGDVFDMFVRGKGSALAAPGGLGIGLTLAKTLVEMHGGTIAVTSDGANRGSEFTIALPIAVSPSEPRRTVAGQDNESNTRDATTMRILIVEDNGDARELLSEALASKGHEVRTASDGPAAFHVLEEWQPDVALLDIGLPGMTGHDVARRVRANPQLRHVALVALTGWGQEKDRRLSADSGIDHHLTKPVDPEQLERVLAAVVRH